MTDQKRSACWSWTILAPFLLIGPPASAAPDTYSVPALQLTPKTGAAGQAYIIDFFMQVCFANKDDIERVRQYSSMPGWHTEVIGNFPTYKVTTGRAGWPEIETVQKPDAALCGIVWTLDPNQGVGSIQDALENRMHLKIDGSRITNGPKQTVFSGSGDDDEKGFPRIILNENISETRASFEIMLYGTWAK